MGGEMYRTRRASDRKLTLCTQLLRPLVYQRFTPTPDRIREIHVIFGLGGESGDGFAGDDRLAGRGVDDTREDCFTMAPIIIFRPLIIRSMPYPNCCC